MFFFILFLFLFGMDLILYMMGRCRRLFLCYFGFVRDKHIDKDMISYLRLARGGVVGWDGGLVRERYVDRPEVLAGSVVFSYQYQYQYQYQY